MARPFAVGTNRTDRELFGELCEDLLREADRGLGVDVTCGGEPFTVIWSSAGESEQFAIELDELRRDGVWAVRERMMARIARWKRRSGPYSCQ